MILADSMAKYVSSQPEKVDVRAFRGDTVRRLTDRIAFGEVDVRGYSRILIHVGCNDISNLISKGELRYVSIIQMMDRFRALRNTLRRKNSSALLLFSSVLPRRTGYKLYKPLIHGLNFALEKFCAKSRGTNVFVPSFRVFLSRGQPRTELFSESDGLHVNGAGVIVLEACFQQALSTGYLMVRVKTKRARKLADLPY